MALIIKATEFFFLVAFIIKPDFFNYKCKLYDGFLDFICGFDLTNLYLQSVKKSRRWLH